MSTIKILSKISFPQDEPIYRQGDISEDIFLISSGTVEIYELDGNGQEKRLRLASAGFTFGEQALVGSDERKDSARAITDVELVAVNRRNLDKQLKTEDPFVAGLFRIMQNNLQSVMNMGKAPKEDINKLAEMMTVTDEEDETPENDPFS